jgi:hypothetical protein
MKSESDIIYQIHLRLSQITQNASVFNALHSIVTEPIANYSYNFFEFSSGIIQAIRVGIPYELFKLITAISPLTESEWVNILRLSTKSIHR